MRALALPILLALAACGTSQPSSLAIVDATTGGGGDTLHWCERGTGKGCGSLPLAKDGAVSPLTLAPGTYAFRVTGADGPDVQDFVYGVGSGERPLLVLFGLRGGKGATLASRVGRWLGGSDHRIGAGLGPAHMMVGRSAASDAAAKVRLANLVPGGMPLRIETGAARSSPVAYGMAGDGVAPGESGIAAIRYAQGGPVLARVHVPPEGRSVVLVTGIDDGAARSVVVE